MIPLMVLIPCLFIFNLRYIVPFIPLVMATTLRSIVTLALKNPMTYEDFRIYVLLSATRIRLEELVLFFLMMAIVIVSYRCLRRR